MTAIDLDATTPKHLADKYAIVGVGETEYMRGNGSGRTTRAMGTQAIRAATDEGLRLSEAIFRKFFAAKRQS